MIGRRVERLSDAAVAVLEAAAVNGRDFDLQVLAESGVLPREALLDGARGGRARRISCARRPADAGRWAFSHALVRDALYDELSSLRRARLHAAVADGLVRAGGSQAEAAFHAYEAAALEGPAPRGGARARRPPRRRCRGSTTRPPAAHLARALQALELDPGADPPERADLLLARGDALARAADPEARAAFAAARALARAAGDAERLGRAALGACGVGVTIIAVDRERAALLEEAIAALGDGAPALRARLLARLAIELVYVPARDRSGPLSEAAVAAARESGDPGALLAALNARHVALWHPDGLAERVAVADELIALAAAHDRPEDELQGRNWRAVDLWEAGDLRGVRRRAASATRARGRAAAARLPLVRADVARRAAAVRGDHGGGRARTSRGRSRSARRTGDGHAELCAKMLELQLATQEQRFEEHYDFAFVDGADRQLARRAPPTAARARGRTPSSGATTRRAPTSSGSPGRLGAAPVRLQLALGVGECAEAIGLLGDAALAHVALRARLPLRRPDAGRRPRDLQPGLAAPLPRAARRDRRAPVHAVRHFAAALDGAGADGRAGVVDPDAGAARRRAGGGRRPGAAPSGRRPRRAPRRRRSGCRCLAQQRGDEDEGHDHGVGHHERGNAGVVAH